ncbi:MAG TPA: ABC transporter transmembrane domain-containing protein, partial [Gemmatimonadaceae bacterium]|nr:ABC transporter transmembrane domain-containing protein [Gemmatimonadaceae bacterium]
MAALRRLLPYYRPYRRKVATGLGLVVVSSALASVVPWLLSDAIDAIRAGARIGSVIRIALAMVAAALVAGALRYWMRELLNGVSRFIEFDVRNDLFARLTHQDAGFYARLRTGDLMARATNDLGAVRMAAGPAIMYLTNTIFGGVFALAFMLRIDVRLTLLALAPMVLMPIITVRLGRMLHDRFESVQEHFATMTTMAQEHIAGVRIVRAYRQESAEVERFARLGDVYLDRNLALARLYGIMHPVFSLLSGLGVVIVLWLGGLLALRGTISVGAFVAFGFYLGMLTWPLIALGWVINLFQRGAASMRRLLDVLDAVPAVREPEQPAVLPPLPPGRTGRTLEFRDVWFHYPSADAERRWVLRGVSFTVAAGESLGVVGATASGKSALMDLIPRLHDPQRGEILLDGVPIRSLALDELRREIGYVPQESFLFSDTIRTNIGYGLPESERASDATSGDGEAAVPWAAGIARLDDSIRR